MRHLAYTTLPVLTKQEKIVTYGIFSNYFYHLKANGLFDFVYYHLTDIFPTSIDAISFDIELTIQHLIV